MKRSVLSVLRCPVCASAFEVTAGQTMADEIVTGQLTCTGCRAGYPIVRGVPRFVSSDSYADAFSFEWNAAEEVVAGIELSGISMSVVTPPAAAALVAVSNPSHSVRPGSLM